MVPDAFGAGCLRRQETDMAPLRPLAALLLPLALVGAADDWLDMARLHLGLANAREARFHIGAVTVWLPAGHRLDAWLAGLPEASRASRPTRGSQRSWRIGGWHLLAGEDTLWIRGRARFLAGGAFGFELHEGEQVAVGQLAPTAANGRLPEPSEDSVLAQRWALEEADLALMASAQSACGHLGRRLGADMRNDPLVLCVLYNQGANAPLGRLAALMAMTDLPFRRRWFETAPLPLVEALSYPRPDLTTPRAADGSLDVERILRCLVAERILRDLDAGLTGHAPTGAQTAVDVLAPSDRARGRRLARLQSERARLLADGPDMVPGLRQRLQHWQVAPPRPPQPTAWRPTTEDVPELLALLADDSATIVADGDRVWTIGELALFGLAQVWGSDPRSHAGQDPATPWTTEAQLACAEALVRGGALDPAIRLASAASQLAPRSVPGFLARLGSGERLQFLALLARQWADHPPSPKTRADRQGFIQVALAALEEAALATTLRRLTPEPGTAMPLALLHLAAGDAEPLALVLRDSHAEAMRRRQEPRKTSSAGLAVEADEIFLLLQAACALPSANPQADALTGILTAIVTAPIGTLTHQLLLSAVLEDDLPENLGQHSEALGFVPEAPTLRAWVRARLLADTRSLAPLTPRREGSRIVLGRRTQSFFLVPDQQQPPANLEVGQLVALVLAHRYRAIIDAPALPAIHDGPAIARLKAALRASPEVGLPRAPAPARALPPE